MNLILNNLYRNIANGKYYRLVNFCGVNCMAHTDDKQKAWYGPAAFFRREFADVNVAYAGKVGPSEHK